MNGWFLAIIILNAISLGVNMSKHGQPKTGKFHSGESFLGALINIALVYFAIKAGL